MLSAKKTGFLDQREVFQPHQETLWSGWSNNLSTVLIQPTFKYSRQGVILSELPLSFPCIARAVERWTMLSTENLYLVGSVVCFVKTYPLVSHLSGE